MYRCRHEQEEDPYASGNENRRRNRDRLNGDIERYNSLRRFRSGGHGLPVGGPPDIPAAMFGRGGRGPSAFRLGGSRFGPPLEYIFGVAHGPRGCPGLFGPRPSFYLPPSFFDDDDDNEDSGDEDCSPPPRPPPWVGTSPLSRRGLFLLPLYGRLYGGQRLRVPYRNSFRDYDDYENGGHLYMPLPLYSRRRVV